MSNILLLKAKFSKIVETPKIEVKMVRVEMPDARAEGGTALEKLKKSLL